MRVRAIQTGFYGCLRVPGTDSEEFDVPDGEKATWFVQVNQPGTATVAAGKGGKKAAPTTDQQVNQPGDGLV